MIPVSVLLGVHSLLGKTDMQIITIESNKYSIEVRLQCFGDTKEGAVNLGNEKFLRGSIWMDLKELMLHWEKDISGRGKSFWKSTEAWKPMTQSGNWEQFHRVRELRTILHSKTGGDGKRPVTVGDEQGELSWGQTIKGLVYFPTSLVFVLLLLSQCWTTQQKSGRAQ